MFNLFSKIKQGVELKKTQNEVIEEIHERFYTEVDKLLSAANIYKSQDTEKQLLIDKSERLKALGFKNTKEVKEAEAEIERLNEIKRENEWKKDLIEAINYFSFRYPNYKFITEESVKTICAKYNLVYGEIDKYIGTVPDKNIKHIENFKIHESDECFEVLEVNLRGMSMSKKYISFDEANKLKGFHDFVRYTNCNKKPLEIVAPLKDFNMEKHEIKDFKLSEIVIPDPVVLKPVFFKDKKYYLIVTAWGLEAGDEIVVNANHN